MNDNDILAFPVPTEYVEDGMTLRDYFAAKAMAAMLSNPSITRGYEVLTETSYAIADKMLAERAK